MSIKEVKIVLFSFIILSLSACSGGNKQRVSLSPVNNFSINEELRDDKNYAINKIHNTYVGEEIVRRKIYLDKVQDELVGEALINTDMRSNSGNVVINFTKGKEYPVSNRINLQGRNHYVLEKYQSREDHIYGVIVSEDGALHNRVLNGDIMTKDYFQISPMTTKFKVSHKKTLKSSKMLDNFAIVFGGINDKQMSFTYREFTPDDVAKTAFFQNLTYPVTSKIIRFKSLKIKVHNVTSESITYEVVEE